MPAAQGAPARLSCCTVSHIPTPAVCLCVPVPVGLPLVTTLLHSPAFCAQGRSRAMPKYSRYTIVVDNLSSSTRSADLEYEFKYAGRIRRMEKDNKARCALIEYDRAADADYAYHKLHGIVLHGRELKVEYATRSDFKFFDWKWTEDTPSPSPVKRGRSHSRSRSRSASRSRSRSRPGTPQEQNDNRGAVSDAPAKGDKDRGASESPVDKHD